MSATLFVSDLHLCSTRPAIARLFLDFLARHAKQADALYILGDLFEYWAGDDDLAEPFNARICSAIHELAESGTQVFFLPGNRDFLADADFARVSGANLLTEPHRAEIGGIATLLLHGDTLCSDDSAYQEFRCKIRSVAWRSGFLAQPLAERKSQIEALRQLSEREKRIKSAASMDVNADAVAAAMRSHGYPRLIHGHTHRLAHHEQIVDGRTCERWVLGDWYDSGNYLLCDRSGCRFVMLPAA
ncbi:MAG: UDP-2,3-diacylglucosamine diphosphatase [Sterolibacterium sp.]|nr:UDP-2,3-diacylglucosamine diphosphatase [Sterolibacterium sp.]